MKSAFLFLFTFTFAALAFAQDSLPKVVVAHPVNKPLSVAKWTKLELGVKLPAAIDTEIKNFYRRKPNTINPFAEEDISVEAVFTSPSGIKKRVFGFYYQTYLPNYTDNNWDQIADTYPFRIRFAPDELGMWKAEISVTTKKGKITCPETIEFGCRNSNKKGTLLTSPDSGNASFYFKTSEGNKPFFAVTENITHSDYNRLTPASQLKHNRWIKEFAEAGGNFTCIELGAQNFSPDWDNIEEYSGRMDRFCAFDDLVNECDKYGVYFTLFMHHVEFEAPEIVSWWKDRPIQWNTNQFHTSLGLKTVDEYFTSEKAWIYIKRRYRYIFSRWGYSPSFAAFEFKEVDNYFGHENKKSRFHSQKAVRVLFFNFVKNIKEYIKKDLGYSDKLIALGYASLPAKFNSETDHPYLHADIAFCHKYGETKEENYAIRAERIRMIREHVKIPILYGEIGTSGPALFCATGIQFHNDIWATSFMGCAGNGRYWWWDRGIHDFGFQREFQLLAAFFEHEDLGAGEYVPYKWSDKKKSSKSQVKKRKLEMYYLVNNTSERVLGWVHNATSYWRNLYPENSKIKALVDSTYFNDPCIMEDGYAMGCKKCVRDIDYTSKMYEDAYGKVLQIENPEIVIEHLLPNKRGEKRNVYAIAFYSTQNLQEPFLTKKIEPDASGKCTVSIPDLTGVNQDYAFKVQLIKRESGL